MTSLFTIGDTITYTFFFVYNYNRMIHGYFRGKTSANPNSKADPIIFSVPAMYAPINGKYTTIAQCTWTVNKMCAINYYNSGIVFASTVYYQSTEVAFSFCWGH